MIALLLTYPRKFVCLLNIKYLTADILCNAVSAIEDEAFSYAVFTLTDPIPILLSIHMWVLEECTVILSESDTLSESESDSVNAPLFFLSEKSI